MTNNDFFTATFNIEVAREHGTDAAIMLSNILFWCKKNKANNKNFHEGTYWTYNTREAFAELFPYLTTRQIDTILKNLIQSGLVRVGNFNLVKYDRTLWYTVDETLYNAYLTTITPNGNLEVTGLQLPSDESVTPIPDTSKIFNTDVNSCATSYTFEQFWDDYGVKKNRHESERKFKKLTEKERLHIKTILPQYKLDTPEVQFRKHPTSFLNQKVWLDYDTSEPKTTTVTQTQAETDEQKYQRLMAVITEKPFDNNRFSLQEREFICAYQYSIDRFPPDDRKLVSTLSSLTRKELNEMEGRSNG